MLFSITDYTKREAGNRINYSYNISCDQLGKKFSNIGIKYSLIFVNLLK